MRSILSLIGIFGSFFMLYYREQVGNMLGEAEWMRKVGGVYNFVIILAILIFLWGLAEITGTTSILFRPILWLLPLPSAQQPAMMQ
ncbi:hypothetical protein HZA45_02960 [Candidatus Peregrinibacteria bacterium]|nr:hypothetical protein [Candidatus Peregrinibacteria bacterium]